MVIQTLGKDLGFILNLLLINVVVGLSLYLVGIVVAFFVAFLFRRTKSTSRLSGSLKWAARASVDFSLSGTVIYWILLLFAGTSQVAASSLSLAFLLVLVAATRKFKSSRTHRKGERSRSNVL